MSVAYQLAEWLADGRFQSGEMLGQRLGVSRAAVWKRIRELERLGLPVQSLRGKGYRLAEPLELLRVTDILADIAPEISSRLAGIEYFHEIASTNDYLREHACESGTVCLAERQTREIGRAHV